MTHDAEVTMALYQNLLPEEERVLKEMERDILRMLMENSLSARPIWTGRTEDNIRFVQLALLTTLKLRVLLELPSSELATISSDVLLSRLEKSISQG